MPVRPTSVPQRVPVIRRSHRLLAAGVFAACFLVTLAGWAIVRRQVEQAGQQRFDRLTEMIAGRIRERFRDHQRVLEGLAGLIATSDQIRRDQWREYLSATALESHPGALGYGFVRKVPRAQLPGYLRQARADYPTGFNLHTTGNQPNLFVVEIIEPFHRNAAVLGLDLASDPARLRAALRSIEVNGPTLSAPLRLAQPGSNSAGLLLLQPVYRRGQPTVTAADRWNSLIGWTYAPLRIQELFSGLSEITEHQIDFEVFDGAQPSRHSLLFDADQHLLKSPFRPSFEGRRFHRSLTFPAGGRDWTLTCSTRPQFDASGDQFIPLAVLGAGIVVSLLASMLTWSLGMSRTRAINLAGLMTSDLRHEVIERQDAERALRRITRLQAAIFDSAAHGIIVTDSRGVVVQLNPAAERLLGTRFSELPGNTALDFYLDSSELQQRAAEFSKVVGSTVSPGFDTLSAKATAGLPNEHEWTLVRPDRSRLRATLAVSTLTDDRGAVTGFLALAVDVTARRAAEKRLQTFVEHAPAAVAMLDADLRYIATSRRWLSEYRIPAENIAGRSHYEVFPNTSPEWRAIHQRCLNGAVETSEGDRWRPPGWEHDQVLRWEIRPWFDASGAVGGLMIFSQDITAEHLREQELLRLRNDAEAGRITLESIPYDLTETAALEHQPATPPPASPSASSVPHAPQSPSNAVPTDPTQPTRRVLLVEDTVVNQKLAIRILERLRCHVTLARDGVEAVASASDQDFDVILMDCQLPEMDGYEATRRIRALEAQRGHAPGSLPILALTASVLPEDRVRCLEAGMNDVIVKPVRTPDIERALDHWCAVGVAH